VFRESLNHRSCECQCQHRLGLASFKRGGGRAEEPIEIGALQPENEPWIGAELPCSHREGGDELAADRFRARSQARRERAPQMFKAKWVAATMTGTRPAT
jgi:hypothetical protein